VWQYVSHFWLKCSFEVTHFGKGIVWCLITFSIPCYSRWGVLFWLNGFYLKFGIGTYIKTCHIDFDFEAHQPINFSIWQRQILLLPLFNSWSTFSLTPLLTPALINLFLKIFCFAFGIYPQKWNYWYAFWWKIFNCTVQNVVYIIVMFITPSCLESISSVCKN
jgi:hypothetical protein